MAGARNGAGMRRLRIAIALPAAFVDALDARAAATAVAVDARMRYSASPGSPSSTVRRSRGASPAAHSATSCRTR